MHCVYKIVSDNILQRHHLTVYFVKKNKKLEAADKKIEILCAKHIIKCNRSLAL